MTDKILLIDDDKELLKMLRRYFERKDYEILTAENGAEGLDRIRLQPDLILLDVNMPGMDGIEVCRRIRDHPYFHIAYENKDEMGMLCMEFEKMREQLARNNQILWKSLEEEKVLRAAIAHDIRSPLSVLKGYQEMLTDDLSNADVPMEQVREMLSESRRQIERMDVFVETMRKMNSLESREPAAGEISAGQLEADLRAELRILEKEYGKRSALQVQAFGERFCGDREIILEVTENLLSNAFRYGRHQVEIMVRVGYSQLSISVRGDGEGFQEEEERIMKPHVSSKQYAGDGLQMRLISEAPPRMECRPCEPTLEDAYIYITNRLS